MEGENVNANMVLAWLGRWRDHLPPDAVSNLQDILSEPLAEGVEEIVSRELEEWLDEDGNDVAEYGRRVATAVLAAPSPPKKLTDGELEAVVHECLPPSAVLAYGDIAMTVARAVRHRMDGRPFDYLRREIQGGLQEKYNELLYEVQNKYPGETRHETALRHIRQGEKPQDNPPASAVKEER